MQASTWWLLALPILFALGWIAAKIDSAQLLTQTRQLPESYFKGLNYLLNEQSEQAISAFEDVARLDPDIAELYFALGHLFRRRGDTPHAIRIHKNLLERADLPDTAREQALFNLGQDYLAAGIFDKAEAAFNALSGTHYALQAQLELARLYEKESNWIAAIQCLQNYQLTLNQHHSDPVHSIAILNECQIHEDLSHYACELALQQIQAKQFDDASESLSLAQSNAPHNPRVLLYQLQLCLMQLLHTTDTNKTLFIKLKGLLENVSSLLEKRPNLTTISVQTVITHYINHSDDKYKDNNNNNNNNNNNTIITALLIETLIRWTQATPTADVIQLMLPIFKLNLNLKTDSINIEVEAISTLKLNLLNQLAQQLNTPPQRLSAASLILNQSFQSEYHEYAHTWQQNVAHSLEGLIKRYDKPTCKQCGFKASRHYWRCPGCAKWDTLPYTQDDNNT